MASLGLPRVYLSAPHCTGVSHWTYFCLNIHSRPEVGEDYAADFADNRFDVCLNTANFVGTDLFALKLILKQNPKKNIEFAKQFFSENTGDPTNLLDYDYQV